MPGPSVLTHPDVRDVPVTEVLFALSDPARLAIVRELAHGPLDMADCTAVPDMPKSTRSHLMKVLREAGVIRNDPVGRNRRISLRRDELDATYPGLLDAVLAAARD